MRTLGEGRASSGEEELCDEDTITWVEKMRQKEEAKRTAEKKVEFVTPTHTFYFYIVVVTHSIKQKSVQRIHVCTTLSAVWMPVAQSHIRALINCLDKVRL